MNRTENCEQIPIKVSIGSIGCEKILLLKQKKIRKKVMKRIIMIMDNQMRWSSLIEFSVPRYLRISKIIIHWKFHNAFSRNGAA